MENQDLFDELKSFLETQVDDYQDQRDLPAVYGTSLLSPHLHFGELSPRQVWNVAQHCAATEGRRVFLSEIGWREFAYHVMYHFPETTEKSMDSRFQEFPWKPDFTITKVIFLRSQGFSMRLSGLKLLI